MRITRDQRDICDRQAAQAISEEIMALSSRRERVIVGLVGGRSVSGIYTQLTLLVHDWSKVHFFFVDERDVTLDDPKSNYMLAQRFLFTPLLERGAISKEQIHPYLKKEGSSRYSEQLELFGGHFDIAVLSCGEDGHIAGLYPNHGSFLDKSEGYIAFSDSPKPPKERVSASRSLLERTHFGTLVFYGEAKRSALDLFLDKQVDVASCPAKITLSFSHTYVFSDLL